MKYLCFLISAFALVLGACESHSWEDVKDEEGKVTEKGTKRLFASHDAHEGDHGEHKGAPEEKSHEGDKDKHGGESAEEHEEGGDKAEEPGH